MSEPIVELREVVAGYNGRPVVHRASLSVQRGECVWISGGNGSGKSTLLRAIAGELPVSAGCIQFEGVRIDPLTQLQRYSLGVGYMPQIRNVFPSLSTRDFWGLVHRNGGAGFDQRCDELLDSMVPLHRDLDVPLSRLSGGQRQLAAFGAVVFNARKLLLLDEPATGLAAEITDIVYCAIRSMVANGVGCLLVEHDETLAASLCSRGVLLQEGVVLPHELLWHDRTRSLSN